MELELPIPVRRVYAHEEVEENAKKVALMGGPIVYCVEAADHGEADPFGLTLPRGTQLSATFRPELLGGVSVIQGQAKSKDHAPVTLTAILYYAWANRAPGPMVVWLNETGR